MGSLNFTVTRGGDTSVPVLVDYTTQGTGTNPVAADDHLGGVFPSGRITIAAGATTGTITVASNPDSTVESDETGLLTITSPTAGVTISPATAIYTFINDDTAQATSTAVFGPAATADTGFLDVGSSRYKIEGTVDNTAWQMWIGGADNDGQPGFFIRSHDTDTRTSGVFLSDTGAQTQIAGFNYRAHPSTIGGVPFSIDVNGSAVTMIIAGTTIFNSTLGSPFGSGNWVRFKTGGAARPSITITKL